MADGVNNDFGLIARMLSDGFNRLDHRLDELTRRLDSKADNTRVDGLEKNLAEFKITVDQRFKPLEDGALVASTYSKTRIWIGNFAAACAVAGVGALLYYLVHLGGHP